MRGSLDRFERTYQPEAFDRRGEEFVMAGPVSLAFDVHKDRDQYRLVGRVWTTLELACGRCLETFTCPVDAAFDLLYLPHAMNTGEGELEVQGDDLGTAFYRDDQIDLGHLMREQFYLALPMKPLCDRACRGLCPECGTNLNRGSCPCAHRWEDSRLVGLKTLLDEKH